MRRWFPWLALVLALAVHGASLVQTVWPKVRDAPHGRDFASYYYALQAAASDQDPYDTRVLGALARAERTRRSVHPFFYPPPYLLTVAWALPLELSTAYRAWLGLDTLFLLAALMALWRWLPGTPTILATAVILATYTPIPDNHWMGQANLPVLALVGWGLWLQHRGRLWAAGALLGLASMMKMSPGLLVLWWFLDARSRPAAWAACGTAVVLSVAALPLLGPAGQWTFYTDVLPGFATGDYNGLTVPLTLSGNHSIANLWAQALPAKDGLSPGAAWGSRFTTLGLAVGTLALLVRRREGLIDDPVRLACAAGALICWMVIIPAYAYEHHLVFLILPWLAVASALAQGRLSRAWAPALALAYAALAWRLGAIRGALRDLDGLAHLLLQEAKFAGIVVLGAACLVAAVAPPPPPRPADPVAPPPSPRPADEGPYSGRSSA